MDRFGRLRPNAMVMRGPARFNNWPFPRGHRPTKGSLGSRFSGATGMVQVGLNRRVLLGEQPLFHLVLRAVALPLLSEGATQLGSRRIGHQIASMQEHFGARLVPIANALGIGRD